jgi:peroxiredoxin (alkyl hydroperoxide reductase subunit C)
LFFHLLILLCSLSLSFLGIEQVFKVISCFHLSLSFSHSLSLSRAFGVHIEEAGLAYRGTFLVDPDGNIKLAEVQDNGIGRNADELVRKTRAALYVASHPGEVCPAKWQPGDKTLKPGLNLVGKI